MFKKLRSKKGQTGIEAVFGVIVVGMIVATIVGTPKFREKKAMQKCVDLGNTPSDCVDIVATVKAQGGLSGSKPEYIRDI